MRGENGTGAGFPIARTKRDALKYDNVPYWESMHRRLSGQLRSVGHGGLSEEFNLLKYESERESFLDVLEGLLPRLRGRSRISILDIGAGTGYWTDLVSHRGRQEGFEVELSVLDLSVDALKSIQARHPAVKTIHGDLRVIERNLLSSGFDLVMSCYCLHHLVRTKDFLNGLVFAARSVRPKGFLLIMDPVLTKPFAYADTIDFASFHGNGIPRHLYLLDDVLSEEGLRREAIRPAVSFILNGIIEGSGFASFLLFSSVWRGLQLLYRKGIWTKRAAKSVLLMDRTLKRVNLGFSSSLCVYRKMGF